MQFLCRIPFQYLDKSHQEKFLSDQKDFHYFNGLYEEF